MLSTRHCIICLAVVAASQLVHADEAKVKKNANREGVYLSAPADDASYSLMGEFAGDITFAGNSAKRMGLQIRPVGGADFDALAYEGGLPGEMRLFNGSDGVSGGGDAKREIKVADAQAMHLIGRRNDNMLVLSGGPFAMFVDPAGCTLINPDGTKLGRLDRVVRSSPSLGAVPPEEAIILFDGKDTSNLQGATVTEDGLLAEGFVVKPMIQDFDMHLEFRLPYMPGFDDQKRSNSGIYIQSRYECQVLDSFAQRAKYNGLGSLYRFKAPDLAMGLPPLTWQTYDIRFTSPRYNSDGSKFSDAVVSSWVNGVKVQDQVTLPAPTGAGKDEAPIMLPINVQDHSDPVRYRNMWMIDRGLLQVDFPIEGNGEPAASDSEPVKEAPKAATETVDSDTEKAEVENPAVKPEADATESAESKSGDATNSEPHATSSSARSRL